MECCGQPFAVGDRVEWTLVVRFEVEPWLPTTTGIELDLQVEAVGDTTVVRYADLVARVDPDAVNSGPQIVALARDHHGDISDDVPTTAGVVRRIRVASIEYRLENRCYLPVTASAVLRDVAVAPTAFRDDRGKDGLQDPDNFRAETGMLVSLETGP
jgi:hypothetical protein